MKISMVETKCEVKSTSLFNKQLKKIFKQNINLDELKQVIFKLANMEELSEKYRNHSLINNKTYKDCYECHIKPDLLLIYKYENDKIVLVLIAIGSHSELFR